jgi:prepilin-type processing-associated H-X9-DG protein
VRRHVDNRPAMKPREILLAIAVGTLLIVAVIAWIISHGKEAGGAASARNLKQWGIALNLYLIDNENQLPETGVTPIEASQEKAWYNALPPYLGQTSLAELSTGQRPRPGVPSLWIDPSLKAVRVWDPESFYFNYAMNRALQPQANVRSFKINELNFPGNVVFLTEVDGYEPDVTPDTVVFRHGGKSTSPTATTNVLFCDGHVAPVTRALLVDDPASRSATQAENGVSWFEQ